jgi:hypothetical protein
MKETTSTSSNSYVLTFHNRNSISYRQTSAAETAPINNLRLSPCEVGPCYHVMACPQISNEEQTIAYDQECSTSTGDGRGGNSSPQKPEC